MNDTNIKAMLNNYIQKEIEYYFVQFYEGLRSQGHSLSSASSEATRLSSAIGESLLIELVNEITNKFGFRSFSVDI